MYADVFWDLKIYVFEALARVYKIQFFLSVHLGGLPPPPKPKSWLRYGPSLQKWLIFFVCVLACQLLPPETSEDPFLGEYYFFGGGGGGGGGLSAQNFGSPYENPSPPPPPVPPTEKILATQLSVGLLDWCTQIFKRYKLSEKKEKVIRSLAHYSGVMQYDYSILLEPRLAVSTWLGTRPTVDSVRPGTPGSRPCWLNTSRYMINSLTHLHNYTGNSVKRNF